MIYIPESGKIDHSKIKTNLILSYEINNYCSGYEIWGKVSMFG